MAAQRGRLRLAWIGPSMQRPPCGPHCPRSVPLGRWNARRDRSFLRRFALPFRQVARTAILTSSVTTAPLGDQSYPIDPPNASSAVCRTSRLP